MEEDVGCKKIKNTRRKITKLTERFVGTSLVLRFASPAWSTLLTVAVQGLSLS